MYYATKCHSVFVIYRFKRPILCLLLYIYKRFVAAFMLLKINKNFTEPNKAKKKNIKSQALSRLAVIRNALQLVR